MHHSIMEWRISMTSGATGIEAHPDIAQLRNSYELAAEKTVPRVIDGLTMLSGLYLALSPRILVFSRFPGTTHLQVNQPITRIAAALKGTGLATVFDLTPRVT